MPPSQSLKIQTWNNDTRLNTASGSTRLDMRFHARHQWVLTNKSIQAHECICTHERLTARKTKLLSQMPTVVLTISEKQRGSWVSSDRIKLPTEDFSYPRSRKGSTDLAISCKPWWQCHCTRNYSHLITHSCFFRSHKVTPKSSSTNCEQLEVCEKRTQNSRTCFPRLSQLWYTSDAECSCSAGRNVY